MSDEVETQEEEPVEEVPGTGMENDEEQELAPAEAEDEQDNYETYSRIQRQ